jgi:hypothetical protein
MSFTHLEKILIIFVILLSFVKFTESFNLYKEYKYDSIFFELFNSHKLQNLNKIIIYNQVLRM